MQKDDLSFKPKLQLGNGYPLNFTYLARILQAICLDSRGRIPLDDLTTTVGLNERHVKQVCSFARALGLLSQITYKPTPLGRLIQQHDVFFGDPGTLWFLHYVISSDPYNLVWHRMVTSILPSKQCITRHQARYAFTDLQATLTEYSSQRHVLKELNTMFDAYINQQFAHLGYLSLSDETYILHADADIPPLVLGACIACFRQRYCRNETAVSVEDLLINPAGPSIVLQLSEIRLRFLLERLRAQPDFSLESRADLDQVRLALHATDYSWMERYYASR